MNTRDPHALARRRLAAYRLDLLTEAESASVRDHLGGCDACRDWAAEFDAEGALRDADAHLPAAMIATWPEQSSTALTGLERDLVRSHLAGCAQCRAELEEHGHAPELPRVPELELDPERAAVVTPISSVRPSEGRRSRWRSWHGMGLAAAAVLAVAVGIQMRRPAGSGSQPQPGMHAPQAPLAGGAESPVRPVPGTAPPSVAETETDPPLEVALLPPTRSAAPAADCFRIGGHTRVLEFKLSPQDVYAPEDPATTEVVVRHLGAPGDAVWGSARKSWDAKHERYRVRGSKAITPGWYRVYFVSAAAETLGIYTAEFCKR